MVKLLIVYNKVWSYREPIFDLINKQFDLTVAFTDSKFVNKKFSFKTIYTPVRQIGPFFIHRGSLRKLCAEYDAVLAYNDISWLSIMALGFTRKRRFSLTYWGIGVTASYKNNYDQSHKYDSLRYLFGRNAESLAFYCSYPVAKYIKAGFDPKKLFVADNTTQVSFSDDFISKKEAFLFVGTLYKQKGIDTLLESYKKLNLIDEANTPELNIIGEGPERSYIEEWIKSNNLSNKIFLHGAIYDIEILKQFYNKSLACISPNQAGLSVLTSMGYATVFVTEKNAITGGEIFSITNEVNGIIYEGQEKLTDTLLWIINNKDRVIKMGANAREFYCQNRRPDQMAGSLIKAVEYALELKGKA